MGTTAMPTYSRPGFEDGGCMLMLRLKRRQRGLIGVLLVSLGLPLGGISAGATTTFQKTLAGPSIAAMYPSGLDWDGALNRIVVADTGRDRVDFYAPDGTKQGEFGIHGPADGQFDSPRDLAVDSQSSIYVADAGNNRIQKFDKFGNHLWTVGGIGSCQSCLNTPIGISWDAANQVVLVASTGQNLIKAFDANGTWKWKSPAGSTLGVTSPRETPSGMSPL